MLTRNDVFQLLESFSIRHDDIVTMHSSLREVGPIEGGADGLIDALKDYLCDGLLLIPTHTWANVGPAQPVYNVKTAVPCIGALPRTAAFRPDGIRSLHPTHSLWATGKDATAFVAGEETAPTPGTPGFAWDRLASVGAKILLLGVGNDKNTFIHSVEEVADIPDRLAKEHYEVTIIDSEGQQYSHPYYAHHCSRSHDVSLQFPNFEKALIARGAQTFGKFGNAQVRIVDAAKCKEVLLQIFQHADRDLCIEKMEIPEEWYREA